jgi:hypothetical protein
LQSEFLVLHKNLKTMEKFYVFKQEAIGELPENAKITKQGQIIIDGKRYALNVCAYRLDDEGNYTNDMPLQDLGVNVIFIGTKSPEVYEANEDDLERFGIV